MGGSSTKVGLFPDPPWKPGFFSFMRSGGRNEGLDEDCGLGKKEPNSRSHRGDGGDDKNKDPETRNRPAIRKTHEEKFRTRFDPRITARYDIKALIGRGSFSHVVRVEHRLTRRPFAIKLLEVRGHEDHRSSRAELGVLRRVRHSNVVHLVEVFETSRRVYLVLELATGGELLDRVVSRGSFTERDATQALMMVSNGLRYIHSLGVVHRDLKPENLLYYHPGQDSRLLITDFGLARWCTGGQMVGDGDVKAGGSFGAGSDRRMEGCARSDTADNAFGDSDSAKSLGIIDRKGKGTRDDWRLVDDGKVRDESSQKTVEAIREDGRGDTNGHLSSGDERKIDESLGISRAGGGSDDMEDEGAHCAKISELERSQGLEAHKHSDINISNARGDEHIQKAPRQVLHPTVNHSKHGGEREDATTRNQCQVHPSRTSRDWALRTLCGTPEYLAPEMVAGKAHGCEVDTWALGVISYVLLSGSMPFEQRSRPRLFTAILRGSYGFHGQPWSCISDLAKDFIQRLLCVNPDQRMSAEQALGHPWLLTMAASSSNRNLHRPISRNLRQRASRASDRTSSSVPGSISATSLL